MVLRCGQTLPPSQPSHGQVPPSQPSHALVLSWLSSQATLWGRAVSKKGFRHVHVRHEHERCAGAGAVSRGKVGLGSPAKTLPPGVQASRVGVGRHTYPPVCYGRPPPPPLPGMRIHPPTHPPSHTHPPTHPLPVSRGGGCRLVDITLQPQQKHRGHG